MAEQQQSGQEKTEQATPKRRLDSRKKGQVPRSRELGVFVSLLAASLGLLVLGGGMVGEFNAWFGEALSFGQREAFSESVIAGSLLESLGRTLLILAPLFILLILSVFVGPLALGGWVMNMGLLAPKLERISPLKGMQRIFSARGLMELVKAMIKFLLVGAAAVFVLSLVLDSLFLLPLAPLEQALQGTGSLVLWSLLGFTSVLVLIAMMDVPFQVWEHSRQLKMTRQEVKDEMKETDGRPEVKSRIRERQQEAARRRMMAEVPKADVVITNPSHYAVALRYDKSGAGAPRVVAKGQDLIAARIRELAREHKVPLFSAPPLARALFASTDIGQEIPGNLFIAVAQVLAYIYQLRRGTPGTRRPRPPRDLPVPPEYDRKFRKNHGGNG